MSATDGPPRPFLKWAGGKRQLLSEIEARLPKDLHSYDTYIEPFIGGGAVMFYLLHNHSFKKIVALDINPELILCYKTLQHSVKKVIKELKQLQDDFPAFECVDERKAYFYSIRREWNCNNSEIFSLKKQEQIKRVAKTIFLNKTCFNGLFRVNSKGEFNVPIGSYKNPKILDEQNLINVSKAIRNVEFHHAQYSQVLLHLGHKSFVYLDPPYRPLTTSSSFTAYSKSGFNDNNQYQLAELCQQLHHNGVQFLLSNSDPKNADENDTFFDELYAEFLISRVQANRAINSKGTGRGKITEILVQNYNT